MKGRKPQSTRRRAVSTIWVALTVLMVVAIIGLALDTGYATLTAHHLQNAADAAALAAAQLVRTDVVLAHSAALDVAASNTAANEPVLLAPNEINDPAGDIVIGRYDRDTKIFTATFDAPNAAKVTARRTETSPGGLVGLLFGPIFNVDTIAVSRWAIAMVGGGTGAGLIVLNEEDECTFDVRGTFWLDVAGGDIQVNSDDPCAACGNGTPLIETPDLNITGAPGTCFDGGVEVTGDINPGTPPAPDPLAFLPEPSIDPASDLGTVVHTSDETLTLQAGYYSGGITQLGGTLLLDPGIYILDGAGFQIGGNSSLIAEGVMLYIVGTGYVDITGTGLISITPPDPEVHTFAGAATYESVSIFQARGNTNPSRIIGTSSLDLHGTLYFPSAPLEIGGVGGQIGNQLIADTMQLRGTGQIQIAYDGTHNAPGNDLFLVE
jgi:hypothetical protein